MPMACIMACMLVGGSGTELDPIELDLDLSHSYPVYLVGVRVYYHLL